MPYKKLIEEFAKNFFSHAVLCTMTESIETLDREDEYALGKDVFKDTKYRTHLQEADDKREADDKKEALEVINKAVKKKKKANEEKEAPVSTSSA